MTKAITIAICTHDRPSLLQRCLASLQAQADTQVELLVVDSAPSNSASRTIAIAAGVRYVSTDRPGLNIARNLALRTATNPIIAFIDDDAVADPGWIAALGDSFADPSVGCVTGRVLPLELQTAAQQYFEEHFSFDRGTKPLTFLASDDRPWFPIYPSHLGTGCNMAFRHEVFDVIGPFDEALDVGTPTGGGGDIDIFRRFLQAGFAAVYNPAALVYHQHRVSMAEVRRQFWGYGKTFTALLTKSLLVERDMTHEALSLGLYRFWQQGRWFARRLLKGRGLPIQLIVIETAGHLAGPVAFLRSLRRVQRERLSHLPPTQVVNLELNSDLPATLEIEENHDLYLLIRRNGQPQGSLLIENPGPTVDRARLAGAIATVKRQAPCSPSESISPQSVSVVICTRDRPELLRTCLQSLSGIAGTPHEIIVVDNGSGPETAQVAANYRVRTVREEQVGLCRARNRGLTEVRSDIVAFLDDDTIVDARWLAAIAASFSDPTIACAIGLALPLALETPTQRIFEALGGLGRGFVRQLHQGSLPATPTGDIGVGANMAFRRDALLKHGLFDEALDVGTPAQAGGDIDMFYRVLKGGESILYEPAILVWHRHRDAPSTLPLLRYRYSVGAAAAFAKWTIQGDMAALRLGLGWFAKQHIRELAASLLGLHLLPPKVVAVGLWGALIGPFAYAYGRWQIRRRAPLQITSPQSDGGRRGAPEAGPALRTKLQL
jgi:GT2 family glycosyltransferase